MNLHTITPQTCVIRDTGSTPGRTVAISPVATAASRHLHYGRVILHPDDAPMRVETGDRETGFVGLKGSATATVDGKTYAIDRYDALYVPRDASVQDLDAQVQEAVRRVQTAEQIRQVIAGARQRGIQGINVDLIYGLPLQTAAGFRATVREVLAMAPDRLAVFNFAYLPARFRHQRAIDPAALPGPEEKLSLLEEAVGEITTAGYVFIGMDHFARPGDPLAQALRDGTLTRNFQGYSTHAGTDLIGFGVSAISATRSGYAQNRGTMAEYRAAIEAGTLATARGLELSAEDHLRRDVILDLMCHFALDKGSIERRHGIDFDRHFATELRRLEPLAGDGLATLFPDRIEVTPRGRFAVRNVAMAFDAYLGTQPSVLYSRTV